jgi:hypothetical protein
MGRGAEMREWFAKVDSFCPVGENFRLTLSAWPR